METDYLCNQHREVISFTVKIVYNKNTITTATQLSQYCDYSLIRVDTWPIQVGSGIFYVCLSIITRLERAGRVYQGTHPRWTAFANQLDDLWKSSIRVSIECYYQIGAPWHSCKVWSFAREQAFSWFHRLRLDELAFPYGLTNSHFDGFVPDRFSNRLKSP